MVKKSKKKKEKKSTKRMGRKTGYHRISSTGRFPKSKKTTVITKRRPITPPKYSNRQIESNSDSLEKTYHLKLKSGNLEEAFNFIEEIAHSIRKSEIILENNPDFKLLIKTCKDRELDKIVRLKAIIELRKIDLKICLEIIEEILRNISENIETKIDVVKIIDKSISVISQGDSYIIGNGSVINSIKPKKKSSYFIDPKYCQYPTNLFKISKEINELYTDGYTTPIFGETRVLIENYLIEVIAKNYPDNVELWRTANQTHILSILISNLFRNPGIFVQANIRPYPDNINEIKENLQDIVRRCNNAAHNGIPQTDGQVEELKDKVNRVIPILYELLK